MQVLCSVLVDLYLQNGPKARQAQCRVDIIASNKQQDCQKIDEPYVATNCKAISTAKFINDYNTSIVSLP